MKELEYSETIEFKRGLVTDLINSGLTIAIIRYKEKYLKHVNWSYDVLGFEKDYNALSSISKKHKNESFALQNGNCVSVKFKNPDGVVSLTLGHHEVIEFRRLAEEHFKEVVSDTTGKVFELHTNSFKEAFNQQKTLLEVI
ncbi:hypothetical protein ACUXZJ_07290 [Flavobacterium sp. TN-1]